MNFLRGTPVLRNMTALYLFQGLNYALPLLLLPYLIRVLGLKTFGLWMFAAGIVTIGRVCVNYGFDLTATRQVALLGPERRQELSQLVSDIAAIRLAVAIAFAALCFPVLELVSGYEQLSLLVLIGCSILMGEALLPVWLYQGLERMPPIVAVRAVTRLGNLGLVLVAVNGPGDVWRVPAIEALAIGLGSVASLYYARQRFGLEMVLPSLPRMVTQMRDGATIFFTNVAVQFYTTIGTIVLGVVVGPLAVATFAIAEKIYSVVRGLLNPLVQAVFPGLSRNYIEDRQAFDIQFRVISMYVFGSLCAGAVVLALGADFLVFAVAGERNDVSAQTLLVFALALPFGMGSFFAPMLVSRGLKRELLRITSTNAILGIVLIPPLAYTFEAPGAATAFLIVQIYNTLALYRSGQQNA